MLPGAPELVASLQKLGKEVFFVTNSTLFHRNFYAERLRSMGIETEPGHIITAAYATAWHLSQNGYAGKSVFLFGETGLKEELAHVKLHYLSEEAEDPSDIVIIGLDRAMTYRKLCKAASDIASGAEFIGVNNDGVWPIEKGVRPGVGAFVAALETATGRKALIVGKPNRKMLQIAMEKGTANPAETMMIGDKPDSDIVMGKKMGARTALVLTGLTKAKDLPSLPEDERPDMVADDLHELSSILGL